MRRRRVLPTIIVTALLVPGLVLSAPVAGPCGRCGDDGTCRLQRPVQPSGAATHSCCGETDRSETPPAPSFGPSKCECGRDPAPATLGGAPQVIDGSAIAAPVPATIASAAPIAVLASGCERPPAPPPSPPVFLLDCAFLT